MTPSSPRLPSPPPAAEIQVTPNSPSGGPAATLQATELEQSVIDAHSKRRIHPGTKASEMAAGPPVVPLNEVSYHVDSMVARVDGTMANSSSSNQHSLYRSISRRCTTTTRSRAPAQSTEQQHCSWHSPLQVLTERCGYTNFVAS